jgi:UDP-GlcNAc3NAcA epimerase
MKIITVVGARPQFIKAAVVSREISKKKEISEIIIHTGQHYDEKMSKVFFEDLSIKTPQYNLKIGGGTHGQNTGRMIEAIENIFLLEKPDWLMVFGDTDSTLAGAIAASKLNIPIAHVEAGLRSFNRKMPEEINRILTDHVSTLLFAPSIRAKEHLNKEGISGDLVKVVGDVMYDAILFYDEYSHPPSDFKLMGKEPFILCTIHRAENTDNIKNLKNILLGLASSKIQIIFPIHPRTNKKLIQSGLRLPNNIKIINPVGYLEMLWLEKNCTMIVTDSGGVQKEAFFHGKICLTLREETEWTELLEFGHNILVGTDPKKISNGLLQFEKNKLTFKKDIYGDGKTGEKIVTNLLQKII